MSTITRTTTGPSGCPGKCIYLIKDDPETGGEFVEIFTVAGVWCLAGVVFTEKLFAEGFVCGPP